MFRYTGLSSIYPQKKYNLSVTDNFLLYSGNVKSEKAY